MRAPFLALMLAGCSTAPDVGKPCRLTRPAGAGVAFIRSNDPTLDARFDLLSTGDAECADLACLREAGADFSALDGDGNAHGVCTSPCVEDADCGGLRCQQLAFDPAFLERLRQTDPATYQRAFGDGASALYCVSPAEAVPR